MKQENLKTIQEAVPQGKYPPNPNCSNCKGKGYYYKKEGKIFKGGNKPCVCTFVQPDGAEMFLEFIRGQKKPYSS